MLGLEPDAQPEQVRAAYRRLAMQFHPGRNPGDAAAAERMAEVNDAYAALTRGTYGFVVSLVVSIAGSGKTRALARHLAEASVAHTVIACPTIALIGEVEAWLLQFEVKVPVVVIHSEQSDRSVQRRIGKWFEEAQKSRPTRRCVGLQSCRRAGQGDTADQCRPI